VHEGVADVLELSAEQRSERLKNLSHLRYRHRSGWSLSTLKAAGYVSNPSRGLWTLTDRGRALLQTHSIVLPDDVYRQIIAESRSREQAEGVVPGVPASPPDAQQTPEERIDSALEEVRTAIAGILLQRILESTPQFFENLVLDLLRAMGYGSSDEDIERTGSPGDGGVDGVISLDSLGFEKICVQAKRWQATVGRPEVQAFYGALAGRRVKKGVIITTSCFSRDAIEYARQQSGVIVLIDGSSLARLMLQHGIGVGHRELRLPYVDDDYFES
jgi:restriction system protein